MASVITDTPDPAQTPALYLATVAVFRAWLPRLQRMLQRAAGHLHTTGQDEGPLLHLRLAPDMLPLAIQVEIAANFAPRTCFPLAGLSVPACGDYPSSLAGLQQRLEHALLHIATLPPAPFADSTRRVHDQAGLAPIDLPAVDFVHLYAMPNFFFHVSICYALLRQWGLPLSKGDFDGLHQY